MEKEKSCPEVFEFPPAVYAVGDRYCITVPVNRETVMWVRIGGREYFDDFNGVLCSASHVHKMEVPMAELDAAGEYTVVWRVVNERKAYFSDLSEPFEWSCRFRPVTGERINVYHIADAHSRVGGPVGAGEYFGDDLDLLILNGDIANHSGEKKNVMAIPEIAGRLTKGEIPIIFARGNHDTRGTLAEKLGDYIPTDNGHTYYTVRLGNIWAIVLDCAEDKPDGNAEYGGVNCCHDFRLRETGFLKRVAADPDTEYNAPGVVHRLVIVHSPFSWTDKPPFDIEIPLYTEWCRILREEIKPDLMICGHRHQIYLSMPGSGSDHKGQPCPLVCASKPFKDNPEAFVGGAFTFEKDRTVIRFTDSEHCVVEEHVLTKQ